MTQKYLIASEEMETKHKSRQDRQNIEKQN
jgi:hypothetical protein